MKIAFLNNQLDWRGTGNAIYAYAHYNEEILGNKSEIYTFRFGNHDNKAVEKFEKRFDKIYLLEDNQFYGNADFLYHIKSGEFDGFKSNGVPYGVHAVFHIDPHGDQYATISEWMGLKYGYGLRFVPHVVELASLIPDTATYRPILGIPDDAVVFGRYGGWDSFDIPFVWDVIEDILESREDIWFLFMNTRPVLEHSRVIYAPQTTNSLIKRNFIESTDAMLHARGRGETFGIAVGEFAYCGKPIITYGLSPEKAHYYYLRGKALTYESPEGLWTMLNDFRPQHNYPKSYTEFGPERVMKQFKDVFLDGNQGQYYHSVTRERGFVESHSS